MLPYHTRPACPAEYVPLLFSTFFEQKRAGYSGVNIRVNGIDDVKNAD